jgi:hypothetical protein
MSRIREERTMTNDGGVIFSNTNQLLTLTDPNGWGLYGAADIYGFSPTDQIKLSGRWTETGYTYNGTDTILDLSHRFGAHTLTVPFTFFGDIGLSVHGNLTGTTISHA